MVRLSDVISNTNKKQPKRKSQEIRPKDEDVTLSDSQVARVLSDTQILKVRGKRFHLHPHSKRNGMRKSLPIMRNLLIGR